MNDEQQIIEPVPTMAGYKKIPTFKLWIANQFPYIETDFDAITNYELLQAVIKYLNTIIENENNVESNVTALYNAFVNLHNYVEEQFDSLNLQDEVNTKIDEMYESGLFDNLLNNYLNLTKVFDTYNDMMVDTSTYVNGMKLKTLGYHYINDGGGSEYFVTNVQNDNKYQVSIGTNLWIEMIMNDNTSPEQFGAYGDGEHDDSDALQNYINYQDGVNIYLSTRKSVYRITKQIDLKEKGIVGNGFSAQEQQYYNMNSILVDNGDYSNDDLTLNNIALINVGRDIRNLQLVASTELDDNISGMLVHGYNTNINNINIRGFYDQIIVPLITVSFRVSNLMSIGNKHAGIYVLDTNDSQSTTAYFTNCSWQWGVYSVLFDKEVYGSNFTNIVSEHMKYGFAAECFIRCIFSNIWFEGSSSEEENPRWIVSTASQQLVSNIYENLTIRPPWNNPANNNEIATSQNPGGVSINNSKIGVNSNVGARLIIGADEISTAHANWHAGRKLRITTQSNADGSGYKTPLYISAPNGELYYNNQNGDNTPVVKKVLIGADSNNNEYYGRDIYTKEKKLWSTHDNESNTDGYFYSPMLLTYISHRVTNPQNNGWEIVENNDDTFTLQQINGSTKTLRDPHILISGIVAGSIAGQDTPLIPCITNITSAYSGSYSSYGILKSFKITFKDLTNTIVKPYRFTVALTSEKE